MIYYIPIVLFCRGLKQLVVCLLIFVGGGRKIWIFVINLDHVAELGGSYCLYKTMIPE
jgi:hypothetical protein